MMFTGDKPARVQDNEIAALRAREDANGFVVLPPPERFRRGQMVRIEAERGRDAGAFNFFTGLYDGMDEQQRECVLLNMLGRKVRVTVPARDLQLA